MTEIIPSLSKIWLKSTRNGDTGEMGTGYFYLKNAYYEKSSLSPLIAGYFYLKNAYYKENGTLEKSSLSPLIQKQF